MYHVSVNKLILAQERLHVFILLVLDQMRQRTTGVVLGFPNDDSLSVARDNYLGADTSKRDFTKRASKALFQNMLTL